MLAWGAVSRSVHEITEIEATRRLLKFLLHAALGIGECGIHRCGSQVLDQISIPALKEAGFETNFDNPKVAGGHGGHHASARRAFKGAARQFLLQLRDLRLHLLGFRK